ncbi:MAG: zinc-dependent alcohol dehydrogenase family protein [Acidobacteria bacterium]|nr:zinc-dependent alcohol dehydrogenase family protein [Acidobacteriota bacterium]
MLAAVLTTPSPISKSPLNIEEVPRPEPGPGHVLLKVLACGVCRTDLHIVEGELPPRRSRIIPGHQIVGQIVAGDAGGVSQAGRSKNESGGSAVRASRVEQGPARVGVSWIGGVDGTCPYCRRNMENLCDHPTFTGYSVNGGYAEYALARADFCFPVPAQLDDVSAAPLLCAGIIGFRALRVAGVEKGERVGLFGFGASAHLAIRVLQAWNCEVYVSTRGESHRRLASSLGAAWVGAEQDKPPVELDRAVTFAPSGDVVIAALSSLRKGGVVSINAIHLDRIPQFDYDHLLWGERQIRSVANMTRADARDFLELASEIRLEPKAAGFPLAKANQALQAVKNDAIDGAAVILP